jgi:hypothetical protein
MTQHEERLPALGQPVEEPTPEGDDDFAGEHDSTVVDQSISADRESDKEPESPGGWSGMDHDGPP